MQTEANGKMQASQVQDLLRERYELHEARYQEKLFQGDDGFFVHHACEKKHDKLDNRRQCTSAPEDAAYDYQDFHSILLSDKKRISYAGTKCKEKVQEFARRTPFVA